MARPDAAPSPPCGPSLEPLRRRIGRALADLLYHAEREWLDVRCPDLPHRLDELGWAPDASDAYCPRCGQSVKRDADEDGCPSCTGTRRPWRRIVRLSAYEPPMTRLIHEVKFTRWRRLGRDLGILLGTRLKEAIERARADDPGFPSRIVVVPVPSTLRRRLARGIDHSAVIARAVARTVNGRMMTNLLRRKHRPSQLSVLPSERVANMAGAITPRRKRGRDLSGRLVIVIDDVTTTGATLRGACRAVHAAHRAAANGRVEVWAGVLAVTELERDRRDRGRGGRAERSGCANVEKKSGSNDDGRLD